MFDGNFRSGRREVDYSGSSNRRGRRDLLKNAEVQRKQRHELLRREKAARLVQRVTRGYLTRVHTLKRFVPQAPTDMTALSLCLSYHSYLPKFQTCRKELLLKFHTHTDEKTEIIQQQNPTETNTTTIQQQQQQQQQQQAIPVTLDGSPNNEWWQVSSKNWIRRTRYKMAICSSFYLYFGNPQK
ncbi:hypothetical protein IV203_024639 [Nitzschia inconspicua]|uniref:Uncharacterized protein n=1 Tax=Nitzschia inconspicua TaxID=303405 RepID=A0A9K3P7S7_9STRA|nr:hypothetical protein IV203_024639 [Nitzschia inconspicua]